MYFRFFSVAYSSSALGAFACLTFPLGIHWGSVKFCQKMGCLCWKPPGTFQNRMLKKKKKNFFFGCLGESTPHSLSAPPSGYFIPLKEQCSATLILFKELLSLTHSSPAKRREDERLRPGHLEIARSVPSQLILEGGGVAAQDALRWLALWPLRALSQVPMSCPFKPLGPDIDSK